jgi:hypothetical protein
MYTRGFEFEFGEQQKDSHMSGARGYFPCWVEVGIVSLICMESMTFDKREVAARCSVMSKIVRAFGHDDEA